MDEKYPLALVEGTVLAGQYIIKKVLGQGGFGITYMAVDHKTNQNVAVKEFFPDTLATRMDSTVTTYPGERGESFKYGMGCFLQEAETLAEFIGNESIVKIHTYFEENNTAYFVMDFIEGISFDEYIKNNGGKVDYPTAEKILLPIIDALEVVHSKGIVHRDVTPDNIYITKDGSVKLLDFGAARYSLGDKSRSLDVVLKHGFAPKEQYTRHGKQGPFTDVYTVGASFYFAITGKRPPDSIDRLEEDDLVPPSSLGVSIPAQKEDAILKAMGVQPYERYQTMGEFRTALMQADNKTISMDLNAVATETTDNTGISSQSVISAEQVTTIPQTTTLQQQINVPQNNAIPEKKPKQKWPIFVAATVCASVVLLVVILAIIGGINDKEDKTMVAESTTSANENITVAASTEKNTTIQAETKNTTSQQTTKDITTSVKSFNHVNNISSGAKINSGNNAMCWVDKDGLIYSVNGKQTTIDTGYDISCINVLSDSVVYIKGNKAYRAKLDGSGKEEVAALSGKEIYKIWANDNGMFYVRKQTDEYGLFYRPWGYSGEIKGVSVDYPEAVTIIGNNIYYCRQNSDKCPVIYYQSIDGFGGTSNEKILHQGKSAGKITNMVASSDGKIIYFAAQYDADVGYTIGGYNLTNKTYNTYTFKNKAYIGSMNVINDYLYYTKTDEASHTGSSVMRIELSKLETKGEVNAKVVYRGEGDYLGGVAFWSTQSITVWGTDASGKPFFVLISPDSDNIPAPIYYKS